MCVCVCVCVYVCVCVCMCVVEVEVVEEVGGGSVYRYHQGVKFRCISAPFPNISVSHIFVLLFGMGLSCLYCLGCTASHSPN